MRKEEEEEEEEGEEEEEREEEGEEEGGGGGEGVSLPFVKLERIRYEDKQAWLLGKKKIASSLFVYAWDPHSKKKIWKEFHASRNKRRESFFAQFVPCPPNIPFSFLFFSGRDGVVGKRREAQIMRTLCFTFSPCVHPPLPPLKKKPKARSYARTFSHIRENPDKEEGKKKGGVGGGRRRRKK